VASVRRVIVGASGSPGSLQARRYAQHLARDVEATLVPVLTWLPPCGDLADRRTPCEELRQIWARDARQKLCDALDLAWGTPPVDPPVRLLVRRGRHSCHPFSLAAWKRAIALARGPSLTAVRGLLRTILKAPPQAWAMAAAVRLDSRWQAGRAGSPAACVISTQSAAPLRRNRG